MPVLFGAIRLNLDPLQWSAYLVSLSGQRKMHELERRVRDTEARHKLINQLAHEINPLAALMFTMRLLGTHAELSKDARELVRNGDEMLSRIAGSVRDVLMQTSSAAGVTSMVCAFALDLLIQATPDLLQSHARAQHARLS